MLSQTDAKIEMKPIGYIRTEYKTLEDMPIQPKGAAASVARIVLDAAYREGLADLGGFSHIYLIYYFHRSKGYSLTLKPFMDTKEHGVFATRAPRRPNPIGLSIVRLLAIDRNIVLVEGADLLDGTPILDIKPYIAQFDRVTQASSGWMTANEDEVTQAKSDHRFK
jgi:tRNA-Thr(GGU) m(6)t(6)A37 methyltransferase TsaA